MEARELNWSSPPYLVHNNSHSNYNNLTEIEESRQSHSLSARSQSGFYNQASTSCSQMDPLEKIMHNLGLINHRLNILEQTTNNNTRIIVRRLDGLDERVQNLEKKINRNMALIFGRLELIEAGRTNIPVRVQKRQTVARQEGRQQIRYVNRGRQMNFSRRFRKIQKREQRLLEKYEQLSKSIKDLVNLGGPNIRMVGEYLFIRENRGLNSTNDQILFKFLLVGYVDIDFDQIQRLRNTQLGFFYYCKVQVARQKLRHRLNYLHQTFDFYEWISLLQTEVGLEFRLNRFDRAMFQEIIVFVLSNQNLLRLCKSVKKFTQILCLVKHDYFEFMFESNAIANRLGLTEEESNIAGEIVKEWKKAMI